MTAMSEDPSSSDTEAGNNHGILRTAVQADGRSKILAGRPERSEL